MEGYPRRIACLTEEPTDVLYGLGEQDRIVGISHFTARPPPGPEGQAPGVRVHQRVDREDP